MIGRSVRSVHFFEQLFTTFFWNPWWWSTIQSRILEKILYNGCELINWVITPVMFGHQVFFIPEMTRKLVWRIMDAVAMSLKISPFYFQDSGSWLCLKLTEWMPTSAFLPPVVKVDFRIYFSFSISFKRQRWEGEWRFWAAIKGEYLVNKRQ